MKTKEEDLKTLLNSILSEAFCTTDEQALRNIKRLISEYESLHGFVSIKEKSWKIQLSEYELKTMTELEDLCCDYFGVSKEMFRSFARNGEYVIARHTFMFLVDKYHKFSGVRIAHFLNGRNHATFLYGRREAQNRLDTKHPEAKMILQVEEQYKRILEVQESCGKLM